MIDNVESKHYKNEFTKTDTKIAKAIAIILMLGHHLFAFPNRIQEGVVYISMFSYQGQQIEYFVGKFGKICVCIFMFLSGYGTFLALAKSDRLTSGILTKIRKLYTEYWKVFAVFVPIGFILGLERIVPDKVTFITNALAINPSYNGEWWFITPYIATIILFPIILKFFNRKNANALFDTFLVITLDVFVLTVLPNILGLSVFADFSNTLYWNILYKTLKLMPQFIMGCIFAKYNVFTKMWNCFNSKIILFIVSLFIMLLVFYMRKMFSVSLDYLYAPLFIWAAVSIFRNIVGLNKVLEIIGNKSTGMWLIHSFYCYLFCQSIVFLPKYSILILAWLTALSYASSWGLDFVFNLLKKLYNKMFKKQRDFKNQRGFKKQMDFKKLLVL